MRRLFLGLIGLATMSLPAAASAQSAIEGRVDRLEREMRAVQRKVFPGGAGQVVTADIVAPEVQRNAPGIPATSAVADLTARVSALESQIATLTGQIEQTQFGIRQAEQAFADYRKATDARLAALEGAGIATTAANVTPAVSASGDTRPAAAAQPPRDPARTDAVAAVQRPSTGDAAEDAYTYGFRLWQAKLYPEAQAELKKFVSTYPKHRRASYAQNLLGRAYLDEGKPSLASIAFYDNYKKMPEGERAPDSLFYLGQALIQLKKPADACKVYDELADVYAGRISAQMAGDIAKARTTAKCG